MRYFRDLDRAEEAFQEACLRALKNWPVNGPPRDPVAWLILVGRNVGIDEARRGKKTAPLPHDDAISDLDDAEDDARRAARQFALPRRRAAAVVRLLPSRSAGDAADRAGAAHRVRAHGQGDRARLSGRRKRHGAAHHPRQEPRRQCRRAVRDAGRRRARRAARRRRRHDLPRLQRRLFRSGGEAHMRVPLCEESIRLARLLLTAFSGRARDHGTARRCSCCSMRVRRPGSMPTAPSSCSTIRTAACGIGDLIAEGLALIDKAVRHRRPGPYQMQAAIAGVHAHAQTPQDTDWARDRSALCGARARRSRRPS